MEKNILMFSWLEKNVLSYDSVNYDEDIDKFFSWAISATVLIKKENSKWNSRSLNRYDDEKTHRWPRGRVYS